MKNNSKYWIVTDLDGTLMNEDYDISPAKKTLKMLAELNIPVIPCTSKTASEVRYFRNENGLSDPFIVENGAAIYGKFVNDSSEWELILGKSYKELKFILKNISEEVNYHLIPLNDLSKNEIFQVMDDLRSANVDFLTIGQYLQPSPKHYPLNRYYQPHEFIELKNVALSKGFLLVASSPLTRSSYHADEDFNKLKIARDKQTKCQALQ